mgnify:CR=1 FL=1
MLAAAVCRRTSPRLRTEIVGLMPHWCRASLFLVYWLLTMVATGIVYVDCIDNRAAYIVWAYTIWLVVGILETIALAFAILGTPIATVDSQGHPHSQLAVLAPWKRWIVCILLVDTETHIVTVDDMGHTPWMDDPSKPVRNCSGNVQLV